MKEKQIKKGRKPKEAPLVYRYVFRLNAEENAVFLKRFDISGALTKAEFIRAILFEKEIKVVTIDKSAHDFYVKLTALHAQFRAIGVNYNQVVKALHTNFSEKNAKFLLIKLEKHTVAMIAILEKIIRLIQKFDERWLQK
ncbi:conjugal transfer protein MobA [Aquimarina agarivorans]|uniref:conjugal transfer protein MobA n=1 Tax=Aquimarina agarivorans TaxID=980584 RepID=UPI000248E8DB|nr:conjugal transfer protein MobA [Aquimarina agarivorans]